ncbi:MAG: DUF4062 domain-containing protein, partial [Ruminococcus sp.]|nr:DUF4062 domain-containing protein [Ruminococcus sp.]
MKENKIHVAYGFHVNCYHSYRGDTNDNLGFGSDIRIIRKILDVLLTADCIPAGMEAFVATDAEQFEVIKQVIDLCDYYVLIIGKRYGSISPETGISYTEMEYDYAIDKG